MLILKNVLQKNNYIEKYGDMMDNKKDTDKKNKTKSKKNLLNQRLEDKKKDLKRLANLEEETILISKSINRCIGLLNESAKGDFFNRNLNNISDENIESLRDSLEQLGEQKEEVRKSIKKLQDEIDKS